MSSILDALKKIEESKAQSGRVAMVESEVAAATAELLGKKRSRSPAVMRVSRVRLLFGAATVVVVAGVMMVAALVLAGSRAKAREEIPPVAKSIKTPGLVQAVDKAEPVKAEERPPTPQPAPPKAEAKPAAPAPPVVPEPAKTQIAKEEPVKPEVPSPAPPKAEMKPEPEKPLQPVPPVVPEPAKIQIAKKEPIKTEVPPPAPVQDDAKPAEAPKPVTKAASPMKREPKKKLKEAAVQPSQDESAPPPKKSKAAETPEPKTPPVREDAAPAPKAPPEKPLTVAKREPAPVDRVDNADADEPAAPQPKKNAKNPPAAAKKSDAPINIFDFPALREADKVRLGLDKMKLNMVRTANSTHPYPFAIINMQTVHLGEPIPGSNATLIAVDLRGIAIQGGGGDRFHVRF